jgi:hypothetical protein
MSTMSVMDVMGVRKGLRPIPHAIGDCHDFKLPSSPMYVWIVKKGRQVDPITSSGGVVRDTVGGTGTKTMMIPLRIESDPCTGFTGKPSSSTLKCRASNFWCFGGLGAHRRDYQTLARALYKANRPLSVTALDLLFSSLTWSLFSFFFPLFSSFP